MVHAGSQSHRGPSFGGELSLEDLLQVARLELMEVRQRLVSSVELLDADRPRVGLLPRPMPVAPDDLVFATVLPATMQAAA